MCISLSLSQVYQSLPWTTLSLPAPPAPSLSPQSSGMERYQIQLINESSTSSRLPRRSRRPIEVHVKNLRNRPLTDDNMAAITASVPELYRRLDEVRDLSSLVLVDKQLLRPPKDVTPVVEERPCACLYDRRTKEWRPFINRYNLRRKQYLPVFIPTVPRCKCVRIDPRTRKFVPVRPRTPPPAVVTTQNNVLFQEFSKSLVTQSHPGTLPPPFRCRIARSGNQHDVVEVNGQQLGRVISGVSATWELGGRVVPRQWRVSVYGTDGQMQLSVFCSFPEKKVRRCIVFGDGEPVRRRIDFSDGEPSPSTTPAETAETINRGPPRSKTGLRL